MSGRQYSNQRKAGREHWPLYPKGFVAIRIVQLVLSVCVLGLAGFSVALLSFDGLHLILFVAVATLITTIYHIVAHFGAPHSYNYWAVLSLDIFLLIFWLISFALLATEISVLSDGFYCNGGYDICSVSETYSACVAAAAGVGGLEFALFIVSLVIHSIMVHRHRKAGLHCNPIHSPAGHQQPAIPLTNNAEKTGGQAHSHAYQQQQPQQAAAPNYVQQQPQATYAPSPTPPTAAGYSSPTQQQQYSQQQQQQQVPQQQAPSPLSLQPTGNSIQHQQYSQYSTQNPQGPPYEAPVQHPNNGPYEAQGHR
ncbi:hypothetical protein LQW54_004729 [Pestalotiopsis sp. IQ-011]